MLAAWSDLKCRKISNKQIIVGYVLGGTLLIIQFGARAVPIMMIRVMWPVAVLYILFYIKALGAGDIKIFSVVSLFFEFDKMLWIIELSFIYGAIICGRKIFIKKQFFRRISFFISYIIECFSHKKVLKYRAINSEDSYIAFSICILLAIISLMIKEGLACQYQIF